MSLKDLVIQSQLIPPTLRKGVLDRPRLAAHLAEAFDYPLTIIQAGTGHSKTTTLAAFARSSGPVFWYSITEPDRDPLLFLAHLLSAFNQRGCRLGEEAFTLLENSVDSSPSSVSPAALTPLLNNLTAHLTQPSLLILDDYHVVADVAEINALVERLVDYLPPTLHVILSTRQMPLFAALTRWRAKNQVLTLTRADLAFTAAEIADLFRAEYGVPVSDDQVQALEEETEGWAIALQMIWQHLQNSGTGRTGELRGFNQAVEEVLSGRLDETLSGRLNEVLSRRLNEILSRLPETLEGLFDYLAQEVLNRLPAPVQNFLLTTSVLRHMTGPACDALLESTNSEQTLTQLHDKGLFIASLGGGVYRYQHLFRDFLYMQMTRRRGSARDLHRRAAAYFAQSGQAEEEIYHLLEAEAYQPAAERIVAIGPLLVTQGRLESLIGWIKRIPEPVSVAYPDLHMLLGDAHRLRSRFDEALEYYAAAERLFSAQGSPLGQSRALRGQAQVYLDTIRPIKADSLLESALRLLDPNLHRPEMADLLEQLAENRLNLGHPDQADTYHHEAYLLRSAETPASVFLEGRALLRTGRLEEARRLLEDRADQERAEQPNRPQRFHREISTLLSLVCSLLGDGPAADRYAREGIATGRRLESAFVEAVGYMRRGHALLLAGLHPWLPEQRKAAVEAYRRAVEIASPFRVTRIMVEPLWGLCRAYALEGILPQAESYATQALEISHQAGDEWIGNLVRVSMGMGLVLQGQDAAGWLETARAGFREVGDPHGECAALLWLVFNHARQDRPAAALEVLAELLPLAEAHGYHALLTQTTHLGLIDEQAVLPLLLAAQDKGICPAYTSRLLDRFNLEPGICYHPGFTLYVRTLGPFAVWRGDTPVRPQDWQREKARQLFQLFVTERGRWMTREQIADRLWPHLDADAAARDFKAALNAMNRAIEPLRPHGEQPFFVIRKDALYGLNPRARVVLDGDDFQQMASGATIDEMRAALALYEQDFLIDTCLEDWAEPPREQLRQLFFHTAGRLAAALIREQRYDEAAAVCQDSLARDRCWEPAYRHLMEINAVQGNRPQVQALYNRLTATLQEELGVPPSPETMELVDRLLSRHDS